MLESCTEATTVPKTIWSMAVSGTSARCTSSATTCLLSSRAERSLKAVPDLTKGVRRPATIATRRPGRVAMQDLRETARYNGPNAASQLVAALAQLEQVVPGVDAGGVAVAPL